MKKRGLSILLAMCLVLALLPATALAAETEPVTITIEVDSDGYITTDAGGNYPTGVTESGSENYTFSSGYTFSVNGAISPLKLVINNGTIVGGIFRGPVSNTGTITNGTFNDHVKNTNPGDIAGGVFNGSVTNENLITGGTFNDLVTNYGTIKGGTFNGKILNMGGTLPANVQGTVAQGGSLAITKQKLGGENVDAITVKQKSIDIPSGAAGQRYDIAGFDTTLTGLHLLQSGDPLPDNLNTIDETIFTKTETFGVITQYTFIMPNYPVTILAVFSDYDPNADTTPPTLTAGEVNRTGATEATVKFTSSEAGAYYYTVAGSDVIVPPVDTAGAGTPCGTAEQTITLTNLTNDSTQYVYIKVKDTAGNMSDALKITIPAYVPTVGPFTVTGGTYSVDYVYEPESSDSDVMVLKVQTTTPLTIKNTDPDTPTQHRIKVTAPRAAITLAGVNIDRSSQASYASFEVATADAAAPVTIILANGSTNTLKSSHDSAGVQNGSSPIIITCEGADTPGHGCDGSCGRLEVPYNNNSSGAGIGGQGGAEGSNITISGGNITAAGVLGAGIGGGGSSSGSNITISGGIVTATSQHGSGIGGGGTTGGASNITISGGTVTATGSVDWTGIGGTGPNNVTDLWIRPKPGYQIEVREGLDLSQFPPSLTGEWNITSNLTGNTFSSVASLIPYSVTSYLTSLTGNGAATATYGTDYAATLTAASGYALPETVTVTVGGTELTVGTDYTWSGGVLTIPGTKVTGNIVITAEAVPVPVLTVTGLTVTTQPTLTYSEGETLDLSDMVITAAMSDSSSKTLAYNDTGVSVSIPHGTVLSKAVHDGQTITVTYEGKTAVTGALDVRSTDASITEVTVNGTEGVISGETVTVVLPVGSTLPTDSSQFSITTADGATASAPTSVGNGLWSVTVTAEDGNTTKTYEITISVAQDSEAENAAAVAAAKSVIQNHDWTVAQTTANDAATVKSWIESELAKLNLSGAAYSNVTVTAITTATAGIQSNMAGTNGSFSFTITLTKGNTTDTAAVTTGVITASPYVAEVNTKTEIQEFGDADITDELKDAGYTTVSAIETRLKTKITQQGVAAGNTAFYDIVLLYSTDGGATWVRADKEHFPADGKLPISIPVPNGVNANTHDFYGIHMFSMTAFGKTAGNTENVVFTERTENGTVYLDGFVTGLSPILVGWKLTGTSGGGGGGSSPSGSPPTIIEPAKDWGVIAYPGETATMRITAFGANTYQWYVNRGDGKGFVPIPGATGPSYTTFPVTMDNDGYVYRCVAMNHYGQATSPNITLDVFDHLNIPKTGDNSHTGLYIGIMMIGLAGMGFCAMQMYRRKWKN